METITIIKNIIFDASGVIYSRCRTSFWNKVVEMFGVTDREKFFEVWNAHRYEAKAGKLALPSLIKQSCLASGFSISEEQAKDLARKYVELKINTVLDNTNGVLEKLSNFDLYILSDSTANSETKKKILDTVGLAKFFKNIFSSIEMKARKADPLCFKNFFAATKILPKESIFVGHKEHEIFGARLAGLKTISIDKNVRADYNTALQDLPELISKL